MSIFEQQNRTKIALPRPCQPERHACFLPGVHTRGLRVLFA